MTGFAKFYSYLKALTIPTLLAPLPPFILGNVIAWHQTGAFALPPFLLSLLFCFSLHWGFNALNDSLKPPPSLKSSELSFIRPFTGGEGFIQKGVLSQQESYRLALLCFGISLMATLGLFTICGGGFLGISGCGYLLAYSYRTPLFRGAHRGLGEPTIGFLYGFIPLLAGHYGQAHQFLPEVFWIGGGLLPFVIATQYLNEFPEAESDQALGIRTWVVQLGKARAARLFRWFFWFGYNWIALGIVVGIIPRWAFLTFLMAPFSIKAVRGTQNHFFETHPLIPVNNQVVKIYFTTALLFIISYLI